MDAWRITMNTIPRASWREGNRVLAGIFPDERTAHASGNTPDGAGIPDGINRAPGARPHAGGRPLGHLRQKSSGDFQAYKAKLEYVGALVVIKAKHPFTWDGIRALA